MRRSARRRRSCGARCSRPTCSRSRSPRAKRSRIWSDAATKFAVRALTEGLRQELRARDSAIRVAAVSPGYVETEFAQVFSGSAEAAAKQYSRMKVLEAR